MNFATSSLQFTSSLVVLSLKKKSLVVLYNTILPIDITNSAMQVSHVHICQIIRHWENPTLKTYLYMGKLVRTIFVLNNWKLKWQLQWPWNGLWIWRECLHYRCICNLSRIRRWLCEVVKQLSKAIPVVSQLVFDSVATQQSETMHDDLSILSIVLFRVSFCERSNNVLMNSAPFPV